jgi:hypothetical protein
VTDPGQPITASAAVPAWLKWLVGVLGAGLAAAGPGVGSLYLNARGQARDAETAQVETAAKAEVLRFEAFTKATRADALHNELAQCQATLHELVKNRSGP